MSYSRGEPFLRWLIVSVFLCQVSSFPQGLENGKPEIKEIFTESKRDVSSSGGTPAVVPLLKSPLFNPYFAYPPIVPGKPMFYPPLMSPGDLLLNRLGKSATSTTTKAPPLEFSDPALISSYFKAKKDEFLGKLFERLLNATGPASEKSARSVASESEDNATPIGDPATFFKKKMEFLNALFRVLNTTSAESVENINATADGSDNLTAPTTTPKPTIVPPDFWFPFPKLSKTPKPPKPTKPPKAKKVLKDALDTILLQSLLFDLGMSPQDASISKRAATGVSMAKKTKFKKMKSGEPSEELYIPEKVDPGVYSTKASECIDKLFKILNKTDVGDSDVYVKPKATAVPLNLWMKPSETEYVSKLDAFLDLLIKSLNASDASTDLPASSKKVDKYKGKPSKKLKRSTFLDELLHRVTTTPTPTPTQSDFPMQNLPTDSDCQQLKEFILECLCEKCTDIPEGSSKSRRSLIFKPFGSGFWIPQYLYAAKMGMYLDKLMDSINTEAATEVETETSGILKRSVDAEPDEDTAGLPAAEAAIKLIIAELSYLKNDLIDAFTEGIKAQKDAVPTPKTYGPPGKSFKKPFWGGKAAPPTADPVAPFQKRIDVLNDVFDKLTKVEKTLIFTSQPEYDPKLLANLTEILDMTARKPKFHPAKLTPTKPAENPESPAYFLSKTKEYLQNLYSKEVPEIDDE